MDATTGRHRRPWTTGEICGAAALAAVLVVSACSIAFGAVNHQPPHPADGWGHTPDPATATPAATPVPARSVTPAQLAALVEVTTWTTVPAAPADANQFIGPTGGVAHNPVPVPVYTSPGGEAFARLPERQVGADTWLPIIEERPGWLRVLLPSRPNGSTGWLTRDGLTVARSSYAIKVSLAARRIDLYRAGETVGTWPTSAGADATPTPTGRTFVLAAITDSQQSYSPILLPLGIHSAVLDTFNNGPGTVALHTWPNPTVFGHPASHGCIRVPDAAMTALLAVPAGTVVVITP